MKAMLYKILQAKTKQTHSTIGLNKVRIKIDFYKRSLNLEKMNLTSLVVYTIHHAAVYFGCSVHMQTDSDSNAMLQLFIIPDIHPNKNSLFSLLFGINRIQTEYSVGGLAQLVATLIGSTKLLYAGPG